MLAKRNKWLVALALTLVLAGCAANRKVARLGTERVDIYKKDLADFLPDETQGVFEPPTEIYTTDEKGNEVIPCKWEDVGFFSEGLAYAEDAFGRIGFVDKKGKVC